MVLTPDDHAAILSGFIEAGFVCRSKQAGVPSNPMKLDLKVAGTVRSYRLWLFEVTHGGGGSEVRAADEFRVQITTGPMTMASYEEGVSDLLIGYSRDRNTIVAYDRRWLEAWTRKKEESPQERFSPSVQVKEADIKAGHDAGIWHLTKDAKFGAADIVTMSPRCLPVYLLENERILKGNIESSDRTQALGASDLLGYIRARGYVFDPDLVARYVASIAAKPFVLLAGITGTGKSKLAGLVAEYYSRRVGTPVETTTASTGQRYIFEASKGGPDLDRAALVAVRPDWTDNQPVFGYVNPITNAYDSTQSLDLLLRAGAALDKSPVPVEAPRYFMLLDEMNLARVEYYFSDWLACAESRRFEGSAIVQQPVPLHRSPASMMTEVVSAYGGSTTMEVPRDLRLPTNVIVTGTVNIDESAFGFSPKVLDRGMVIEYGDVDLDALRDGNVGGSEEGYRLPEALPPFRIAGRIDYAKLPLAAHRHLVAINDILAETRLHLGYRGANEAALFMAIYNDMIPEDEGDTDWNRALDAAVLQKVLPRLSGNRPRLEKPLLRLCKYLRDLERGDPGSIPASFSTEEGARLTKSYRRVVEMLDGLRDFGFVSFFK